MGVGLVCDVFGWVCVCLLVWCVLCVCVCGECGWFGVWVWKFGVCGCRCVACVCVYGCVCVWCMCCVCWFVCVYCVYCVLCVRDGVFVGGVCVFVGVWVWV